MGEIAEMKTALAARIERVRQRIHAAAERANRSPKEITLMAVSKTHPADLVREAIGAGLTEFGENRVQEAETKIPEVGREAVRWHLIGHLQSNKARRAVELFDVIHSVDSTALVERLDRICGEVERPELQMLIQVDLGHEATKTGAPEGDLRLIAEAAAKSERLRLIGLMTLPPFFDDPEDTRPFFQRLRKLRDDLQAKGAFGERPGELSMGMTHDFEIAIEEGATMIRVGTAIFGEREQG
jgi:pyridoxal phosphate enzyme (YggS family)